MKPIAWVPKPPTRAVSDGAVAIVRAGAAAAAAEGKTGGPDSSPPPDSKDGGAGALSPGLMSPGSPLSPSSLAAAQAAMVAATGATAAQAAALPAMLTPPPCPPSADAFAAAWATIEIPAKAAEDGSDRGFLGSQTAGF